MLAAQSHDTITVEAPTAREALEEVTSILGPDAEIVEAGKVHRGGVAGFFARELVQLTARRAEVAAAAAARAIRETREQAQDPVQTDFAVSASHDAFAEPGMASAPAVSAPAPDPSYDALRSGDVEADTSVPVTGLAALVAGALGGSDGATTEAGVVATIDAGMSEGLARIAARSGGGRAASFAETLQRYAHEPDVVVHEPLGGSAVVIDISDEPVPEAALAEPAGATFRQPDVSGVAWSADELVRIGLPYAMIDATVQAHPSTDIDWLRALAVAAERHCAPLPTGDFVLAGPGASSIACAVGIPLVDLDELELTTQTVCVDDPYPDLDLLASSLGTRWIHVVAGGAGWERLADLRPLAVSWSGDEMLSQALRLCSARGIALAYGVVAHRVRRALPADVAIAVRELLERA